jgi:trimeric autotransporter adhesin
MVHRICVAGRLLLASLVVCCVASARAQTCARAWQSVGGYPGVSTGLDEATTWVSESVTWDPDGAGPQQPWWVFTGNFDAVGDRPVQSTAAWDGTQIRPMDIYASGLAVHNGQLYASQNFSGGYLGLYRWNGSGWQGVAGMPPLAVQKIASYNGDLYLAGDFYYFTGPPNNQVVNYATLAKWNGTTLTYLPGQFRARNQESLFPGVVKRMRAVNGLLYIGGDFDQIGSTPYSNLVAWNGTSWVDVGGGTDNIVYDILADGSDVLIAGRFTNAGGVSTGQVARWNGTTFSAVGSAFTHPAFIPEVFSIARVAGTLYATGVLFNSGGLTTPWIAQLDEVDAWQPVDGGLSYPGFTLADRNGELMIGGWFYYAYNAGAQFGTSVGQIARYDGVNLQRVLTNPTGFEAPVFRNGEGDLQPTGVTAQIVHNNELFVGGTFYWIDGKLAIGSASWNGTRWRNFNSDVGLDVKSFATYQGDLYAYSYGRIVGAGEGLFRLVGETWQNVPTPEIIPWDERTVQSLQEYQGNLYFGGTLGVIDNSSGTSVVGRGITKWNGTSFNAIGNFGANIAVNAMTVFNGELIVGGNFNRVTHNGQTVNASCLAAWNGTSWRSLNSGIDVQWGSQVNALKVHNGKLYAAGEIYRFQGQSLGTGVIEYDGSSWRSTGPSAIFGPINTLEVHDGDLYAGGNIPFGENQSNGGSTLIGHVMRYDGLRWGSVANAQLRWGSYSSDGRVRSLASYQGLLAAGGEFDRIGTDSGATAISPYWAALQTTGVCCGDIDFNNDDLFPDSQDLEDMVAVLGGGPSACSTGRCDSIDFNRDQLFPDSLDLEAFISRLAGGACLR